MNAKTSDLYCNFGGFKRPNSLQKSNEISLLSFFLESICFISFEKDSLLFFCCLLVNKKKLIVSALDLNVELRTECDGLEKKKLSKVLFSLRGKKTNTVLSFASCNLGDLL